MNHFHAHGKLLLSAEYMVMHGSTALAIPLKMGQHLDLIPREAGGIFSWTACHEQGPWFSASFDSVSLEILDSSNMEIALRLKGFIGACIELMPSFREDLVQWDVETRLEFSPDYGFGSSSTLIALLSAWAKVNPLDLHFRVSVGSGYDVACAVSEGPITYELRDQSPRYRQVPFSPPFRDQLWFAWLGYKQATSAHLDEMSGRLSPGIKSIHLFSQLSAKMMEDKTLGQFRESMEKHEHELSLLLGLDRVSLQFPDLPGSLKSLGAWGGDFVMIATETDLQTLQAYLKHRGIHTLYNYKQLVYEGSKL